MTKLDVRLTKVVEVDRTPSAVDESLADSTQKSLSALGFNHDVFTADWTVLTMARGTTLLNPSLDLCSANYPSEFGRQFRRQMQVNKPGNPYIFLSSEVVRYKGNREATQAATELKARYNDCVKNKGGTESSGLFTDYSFFTLPSSITSKFATENSVVVHT